MTAFAATQGVQPSLPSVPLDTLWGRLLQSGRFRIGGGVLLFMAILCFGSMPFTLSSSRAIYFEHADVEASRKPPSREFAKWFGTDPQGRSLLGRTLLGGAISLGIGAAAATISVVLGVAVGLFAGYRGGWIDALLMRSVDILYGLPYILLVVLFKMALQTPLTTFFTWLQTYLPNLANPLYAANLIVLFMAIGLVSWLTMARVIRGQVLSLRAQPFIEACRAAGVPERRIFLRHLLPNLIGPIAVYATLTVPQAILQESFLSFLGIGIQPPMPTWGSLASEGLLPALNTIDSRWWLLFFPCLFLAITLLSLNFLGDGLRDVFDPKRQQAHI